MNRVPETLNTPSISYQFSYDNVYDEIYETSYGTHFVFCDDEEESVNAQEGNHIPLPSLNSTFHA
ncbi:hypothetical protein K2W90_01085 [Candidatus Babeliales bacterium]|nr:hypothetical protein [Candidatus Babeliales bacterium]